MYNAISFASNSLSNLERFEEAFAPVVANFHPMLAKFPRCITSLDLSGNSLTTVPIEICTPGVPQLLVVEFSIWASQWPIYVTSRSLMRRSAPLYISLALIFMSVHSEVRQHIFSLHGFAPATM